MKRLFYMLLFTIFFSVCIKADFFLDKSIKGTVTRSSTRTSLISAQLNADSNGTYKGRTLVFGGSNVNIQYGYAVIVNSFADNDSIEYVTDVTLSPTAGDSFWILPMQAFELADMDEVVDSVQRNVADSLKKVMLLPPYYPIATDADNRVKVLSDIFLGAAVNNCRWWAFPRTTNPKDSAWIIDPALAPDTVIATIKFSRTNNIQGGMQFIVY